MAPCRRTGLAVLLMVAACGSPSSPPAPPLEVSLAQSRDNENRHLLQVVLTNTGRAPVEVVQLQLRAPGYTEVPPTVREDVVQPGSRIAFPITYGAADCRQDGPATVVVGHRTAGRVRQTELAVPEDDPLLPRMLERECALQDLQRAATVGFNDWQRRGDIAVGRIVVRRESGTTPVTVTGVEGSIVMGLQVVGALPLALRGERDVSVPVTVSAARCDPHALIESKRSFEFRSYIALGDGQPLIVDVRPDDAGRRLLEEVLADTCNTGG